MRNDHDDDQARVGDTQYAAPLATASANQPTHTPGPWEIFNDHVYASALKETRTVTPTDGTDPFEFVDGLIALVYAPTLVDYETRYRANQRLIAAAPDLLAALKRAVETIRAFHAIGTTTDKVEQLGWSLYQQSPEMQQINAAIAKVEGQATV